MRGWSAFVVGLVALAAYPACSSFGGEAEAPPTPPPADAGSDATTSDAAPTPPPGCTPTFPNDFAGCACETANAIRDCAHGDSGKKSRCKAGSQTCQNGKWGACNGATDPLPQETCFDDVDDDCDGVVDNGCKGSPGYELCTEVADRAPPSTPLGLTDKGGYVAGDKVHVFVLWNAPMTSVHLNRSSPPPTHCAGGAGVGVPVSAGKNCESKGWHAFRRTLPASDALFANGESTIELHANVPSAASACTGAAAVGSVKVTVSK